MMHTQGKLEFDLPVWAKAALAICCLLLTIVAVLVFLLVVQSSNRSVRIEQLHQQMTRATTSRTAQIHKLEREIEQLRSDLQKKTTG